MIILLPLGIIGIGFLAYLLFAGATYALPIFTGLAAGFGSLNAGISGPASLLIGIAAFMATIALARFAVLTLPTAPTRASLLFLFAIPAAVAGFSVTAALASLVGRANGGFLIALAGALISGAIAAHRLARVPG